MLLCHVHTHSRTQPPLQDQTQIPIPPFPDKDSSREIAAHLTAYDWNLFTNIQQMEYIYQLFGRHKFGKIVTNLDLLIKRFNEVWLLEKIPFLALLALLSMAWSCHTSCL